MSRIIFGNPGDFFRINDIRLGQYFGLKTHPPCRSIKLLKCFCKFIWILLENPWLAPLLNSRRMDHTTLNNRNVQSTYIFIVIFLCSCTYMLQLMSYWLLTSDFSLRNASYFSLFVFFFVNNIFTSNSWFFTAYFLHLTDLHSVLQIKSLL